MPMPKMDRLPQQREFFQINKHPNMTTNTIPSDDANFINFCQGEDLTNGEQKEGGSCNGIRTFSLFFLYTLIIH